MAALSNPEKVETLRTWVGSWHERTLVNQGYFAGTSAEGKTRVHFNRVQLRAFRAIDHREFAEARHELSSLAQRIPPEGTSEALVAAFNRLYPDHALNP